MDLVFIDTSALYACFDRSDHCHSAATRRIQTVQVPLVTTNYVIDETITLLARKLGTRISYKIGSGLLNEHIASLIRVASDDEMIALEIMNKYDDKQFSFTDCVSFAVMDKLKIKTAFSFDEHFKQYGKFNVIP